MINWSSNIKYSIMIQGYDGLFEYECLNFFMDDYWIYACLNLDNINFSEFPVHQSTLLIMIFKLVDYDSHFWIWWFYFKSWLVWFYVILFDYFCFLNVWLSIIQIIKFNYFLQRLKNSNILCFVDTWIVSILLFDYYSLLTLIVRWK